MAAIKDLINQIEDKELRTRIEQELNKLTKQKSLELFLKNIYPNVFHYTICLSKKVVKLLLKLVK